MREMRRQNVSEVASRTAPNAPSPPPTLGQLRAKKIAIHLRPYARHRLEQSLNFPVRKGKPLDQSAPSPTGAGWSPSPSKSKIRSPKAAQRTETNRDDPSGNARIEIQFPSVPSFGLLIIHIFFRCGDSSFHSASHPFAFLAARSLIPSWSSCSPL